MADHRPAVAATDTEHPAPGRAAPPLAGKIAFLLRVMRSKVVRFAFLILDLVLLALALIDQGSKLWHEVQQLSLPVVIGAFLLNLCGLICSLMVWRELLADLGSRLVGPPGSGGMFIGALGQ